MPCIYCDRPADAREHWLPQSLGLFGEMQVLHDRICTFHNNEFGKSIDQEFIRTGPEAIFRRALGVGPERDGPGVNPFLYRAARLQPVRARQVAPPVDEEGLLWENYSDGGEPRARLLEQVVIVRDGKRIPVPFNIEWPEQAFREAVQNRGAEGGDVVELYLDAEKTDRARPLIAALFPGFKAIHFAREGNGQSVRTLLFENRLGAEYLRGVAKIAFHAMLKFMPQFTGQEGAFAPVRDLILGLRGDPEIFVRPTRQQILEYVGAGGLTVNHWGHVIAIEATTERVIGRLQFFIGPDVVPHTWTVLLGRNPSRIAYEMNVAYFCRYFPEREAAGLDGQMEQIHRPNLIIPR